MGFLKVKAKVANPQQRQRGGEAELLIDSGATFTVIPKKLVEQIALSPEAVRRLRTADGRLLERDQGLAYVEIDEHAGTVPVIFGDEGDIPVLGVTTLEILGLAFDPVKGELRPSEYLYLAGRHDRSQTKGEDR